MRLWQTLREPAPMSDTNGDMSMAPAGELVMFRTDDGATRIEVRLVDETVWLTQAQMVELFQSSKANVSEHIRNVFAEGELEEDSVVRKFRTTAADGKNYQVKHYNLDVIISVGGKSLERAGTVSHRQAVQKAHEEYEKYKTVMDAQPSGVERDYLKEITAVQKQIQQPPKEQK